MRFAAYLCALTASAAFSLAVAQNPPPEPGTPNPTAPANTGALPPGNTPSTPAAPNPHDSLIGNAPTDKSAVAQKRADDRKMKRCMAQQKAAGSGDEGQNKQKCQAQLAAEQKP
jgi:hypothetical protein